MIIYSRHLLDLGIPVPEDAIIRINIAWSNSLEILRSMVGSTPYQIFLDFPVNRKKPPLSNIDLETVMDIISINKHKIKYFAISNAEEWYRMGEIYALLPSGVTLVPKIETVKGIINLESIMRGARSDIIMFDSEDLFSNTGGKVEEFSYFSEFLKTKCKNTGIKILELSGVVFSDEI